MFLDYSVLANYLCKILLYFLLCMFTFWQRLWVPLQSLLNEKVTHRKDTMLLGRN